ncbi:hypothetical protein ACFL5Z_18460 [Planctomycetota bacterium]
MYYKQIDKRCRKALVAFLKEHFRYHTMNSWNRSTSYANCIKFHHVGKPSDIDEDTWWQMLEVTDWHDILSDLLEDFARQYNFQWQAGINGRSGGYVVLYRGGIKPSGYKSYCTCCGQKNYQAVPENEVGTCGKCDAQARMNFKQTHTQVFTWPGKDVDMVEDFEDWTLSELQQRVELVQSFDRLCDDIVSAYVQICKNYCITEKEILVPRTIKVLDPVV